MRRLSKDSILAGVCGLALGDAVGVPFEFCDREIVKKYDLSKMYQYGTHKQPVGTFSDDTSMVLATMDAMGGNVGSLGGIMEAFREWLESGKYTANGDVFDIGGTTLRAIQRYATGEALENCGEGDIRSNGNGALMRMLPMVYYLWVHNGIKIDVGAVNNIYALAGLTHSHIISKVCCVYYVYIALYIIEERAQYGIQKAIKDGVKAVEQYYYDNPEESSCIFDIIGMESLSGAFELKEGDIKSSGYVVDSLEASLWGLYHSTGFKSAVSSVVGLGGDTDTIGAITGSLAGLYYGWNEIPVDWLAELKNKALIYEVCERFFERYK